MIFVNLSESLTGKFEDEVMVLASSAGIAEALKL